MEDSQDKDAGGLSKQEKKELKELKIKKEDGSITKDEKRRYKDLKEKKKGGAGDDDDPIKSNGSSKPSASGTWPPAAASGTSWPPPAKLESVWPPPNKPTAALNSTATIVVPSLDAKAEEDSTKKPKMTKLQMKLEAAKLKKQEMDFMKAAEVVPVEPVIQVAAACEACPSSEACDSEAPRPEAALEDSLKVLNLSPTKSLNTLEDQQKRVFNLGDDDGWKDASIPGFALEDDGEIPEFGPDGKKLSKKDLKKLQRERELRMKEKVGAMKHSDL
jgi:hypothetical protein